MYIYWVYNGQRVTYFLNIILGIDANYEKNVTWNLPNTPDLMRLEFW